jgi:trehalose/maltose hydrolase-like predicted phosphorylase
MALDEEELRRWEDVSRRLLIPFHEGVISQFDGYESLSEFDWDRYRARYGDVRRLDRILEAEGDTVNRYRASKQADVLMLGYLFPPRELSAVFHRLGYVVDDDMWDRTVDYYLPRTSHGSTLSGLVHGWILARERRPDAWRYTHEALWGDVADLQGGTTPEGIHLGAMGGTLDLVQRGLTGLEIRDGTLHVDPAPLTELSDYGFSIQVRGHWGVTFRLHRDALEVSLPAAERDPLRVGLRGRVFTVRPGETRSLDLY